MVDDDPGCQLVLEHLFRCEGWRAWTAGSVQVAREHVEARGVPDLAVVDWSLPDGPGTDLVRLLRTWEGHHTTAIVVCTGHPAVDAQALARAAGCHEFVEKPFDIDELLVRCRRALTTVAADHDPLMWG